MYKGHYTSAGATIDYGQASSLFPLDELNATVHKYRDAELALTQTNSENVIAITPTSMTTSYALNHHGLAAIPINTLPTTVHNHLANTLTTPIDSFDLIQVGTWTTNTQNHSLTEYTDT